uniref:C2H2-type domain-containing protein n=1 Tax=Plectus sambesii TaxID=2011161 RepID=A0A914XBM8_9BILA
MPRLSDIARMSRKRRQKEEKLLSSSKKTKSAVEEDEEDEAGVAEAATQKVNLEEEEDCWFEIPDSPDFDVSDAGESCEKEMPTSSRALEETRVSKRTFVCFSCGATVSGSLLNQHVYQHHLNRALFTCPVAHCGFSSIYSKYTVDIHISRLHPNVDRSQVKPVCRKNEYMDEIQTWIKRCFGLSDTAVEADVRSLLFDLIGQVCADPHVVDMDRLANATLRRRSGRKKLPLAAANDDVDDKTTTKCELCGERVENRTVHARSHSSLPIYQCAYCDYSTHDYARRVRKHIASKHAGHEEEVIDRSREFARELQALKSTCFPLVFGGSKIDTPGGHERCQVCFKDVRATYRTNHVLLYHLKVDMFKCSLCDYSSQHLKVAVKQHIERKHSGESAQVISSIDSCRAEFEDMKEQCFPSAATGKKRGRPSGPASTGDTPVEEQHVKRKYVRREPKEQQQQDSPQPHQTCRLCDQTGIVTKSEHVRVVHMSDKPFFMCPHCDYSRNDFASKLQLHIEKTHSSDAAPIDCSDSHDGLLRKLLFQCFPHTRRGRRPMAAGAAALQQRPVKLRASKSKTDHYTPDGRLAVGFVCCRLCDVTLRKTYRMPHMLINHLGREDAYKCSECDFAGNYKRTIEKHAATVHGSTAFALVNVGASELDDMRIRCFGRSKSKNKSMNESKNASNSPLSLVDSLTSSPDRKVMPERKSKWRLLLSNERQKSDGQRTALEMNENGRKSRRKQLAPRPARLSHIAGGESIESDSKDDKWAAATNASANEKRWDALFAANE